MCLEKKYNFIQKYFIKLFMKKNKDGLVPVYKILNTYNKYITAVMRDFVFKKGINNAHKEEICIDYFKNITYESGFHSYKKQQRPFRDNKAIECYIKKEWITSIGKEENEIVIVSDRIVIPEM